MKPLEETRESIHHGFGIAKGVSIGLGAGLGAGVGAAAAQFTPGGNPIAGAIAGAGIGAAGIALTPLAVKAAAKGTVGLMGKMPDIYAGIGNATLGALGTIGKTAGSVARSAANALSFSPSELKSLGFGAKETLKSAANPIGRHARAATNLMGKFVKYSPNIRSGTLLNDYKFTGFGVAAIATGYATKGLKNAYNIMMDDKMGQRDNYITPVSPQIRLMDNAGATGDLVFALNNNRRG